MNLSDDMLRFVEEHTYDDIHTLLLQADKYPHIDLATAIRQIEGRRRAKDKIPSWYTCVDIIYPKHISLEQASSESTAIYKANMVEGNSMVDLTGGLGIDFYFMAQRFKQATYVEQQAELASIARHNLSKLGLKHIVIENTDAIAYLSAMPTVDMIYIDPARRDTTGNKTVLIGDCTPDISAIEDLLEQKAKKTIIKLSPMLDISLMLKTVRNISDVYIISYHNECKELVAIKQSRVWNDAVKLHCINIKKEETDSFLYTKEEEDDLHITYTSQPATYLYEPNSSIMKAGAYKSIAKAFEVDKLHPSSHLYTSEVFHPLFPGRRFKIESYCSLNKKELKKQLGILTKANITTRNFPLSTADLRKKIGLSDGGDTYIFGTTLADLRKVLFICKQL